MKACPTTTSHVHSNKYENNMCNFHRYQKRSPVGPIWGGITERKMSGWLIWPTEGARSDAGPVAGLDLERPGSLCSPALLQPSRHAVGKSGRPAGEEGLNAAARVRLANSGSGVATASTRRIVRKNKSLSF